MDLTRTPFKHEISLVTGMGKSGGVYKLEFFIKAKGKLIKALMIDQISNDRNYVENYTDELMIDAQFTGEQYYFDIQPNFDDLSAVLKLTLLSGGIEKSTKGYSAPIVKEFKAKLFDNKSDKIEGNNPAIMDRALTQRAMIQTVKFQLITDVVEKLRFKTAGGPFRQMTGIGLIISLLTMASKDLTTDAAQAINGVSVNGNPSEVVREQIILPHLTPITSAPNIINENSGGIFPAGFSYYLQDRHWYVFAPYDVERFNAVGKNLTIVNIPKDRLPGIERTYYNSSNHLIVLSTRDAMHIDTSEQAQQNLGNSVSFMDADLVLNGWGQIDNNKFLVNAAENLNVLSTTTRKDGLTNLAASGVKITANKNIELSKLAKRQGSFLQIAWEYSDESLIYPGMPVRLMYLDNKTPMEAYGVVVAIKTFTHPVTRTTVDAKYVNTSVLTLFIKK